MRLALALLPLALAACDPPNSAPPLPPTIEDTCGARTHAALIGQDATALERILILGMVRVVRPGDFVTQDYRPERINFLIAEDNTIQAINCG